jgi:hypothetical protein
VLSGRSATRPDTLPGELLDAGPGGRSPLLKRGAEPLGHGRVQVVVGRQPPPRDLEGSSRRRGDLGEGQVHQPGGVGMGRRR